MKNWKRIVTLILALAMALALSAPGFAAGAGYSDVAPDAWYAGAVDYVTEHKLMGSVGNGRFAPSGDTSLAMLVTTLWRMEGEPVVNYLMQFSDVPGGAWYTEAVRWAASEQIVQDHNGLFGTNDPVSREELVTLLWRYSGRPEAETGEDFADEAAISNYAVQAVDWARENDIISGKPGNRFDPQGRATRAEVAAILQNFQTLEDGPTPSTDGKTLVVYFSATGSTERVAGYIADALNADTFELIPAQPYTSDDLNWMVSGSRVNREHEDESLRDVKLTANTAANWADYDTVFVGYPIWWSDMPMILYTFFEQYDLSGKTVIPFSTHGGSSFAGTPAIIQSLEPNARMLDGLTISRNNIQDARQEIVDWVNGLALN